MESEGSLPCSRESATGPYPEPDTASPHLFTFILILSYVRVRNKVFVTVSSYQPLPNP
jgi:hypothetical protein